MSRIQLSHRFEDIISLENLLLAWGEFSKGKRGRKDVQELELRLMENLISLHEDLVQKVYQHSSYQAFNISDPKPRRIHKANVRDRVLHHAIYRKLYPFFDRTFIADSYSCRVGKGTHKALEQFQFFGRKVSRNNTRTCWVLKCDVKKFFASIDQYILSYILEMYIPQPDTLWLLRRIICSFNSTETGKGLPLGNLTSQLLVNVYMNEFDQYVKHTLKAAHYIRYADDFVLLSEDKDWLTEQIPLISSFLCDVLSLSLHPDKVYIKTLASGVDFLGWIHFPHHRVLRTATARRMKRRVQESSAPATIQSYRGLLQHGNAHRLTEDLLGVDIL
ncbi:MAG: reverse transcriptase/maturase family protein [Candidatus Andersenbacteria bacterium]